MTKHKPSWPDLLRRTAALACGLLLLNLPAPLWAADKSAAKPLAAKKKRNYWVTPANAALPKNASDWFETAQEKPGSWWPEWSGWLAGHAGKQVAAPRAPGNRQYKPIEAAPGRYVKVKASA